MEYITLIEAENGRKFARFTIEIHDDGDIWLDAGTSFCGEGKDVYIPLQKADLLVMRDKLNEAIANIEKK